MARERSFELTVAGEVVPGVAWTPDSGSGPWPTVLMGHGRGDGKRSFGPEAPGRRWCDGHGWAAVAIDAPGHGERLTPGLAAGELAPKPDPAQSRREWQATIDLLVAEGMAGRDALAYWGLSMGTALGIALIAHEPRISCAVLGLMHSRYYDEILADAARVSCPVHFSLHSEDSRVPYKEGVELFEQLGSADKQLLVYPGDHTDFSAQEFDAGEAFLARRLALA